MEERERTLYWIAERRARERYGRWIEIRSPTSFLCQLQVYGNYEFQCRLCDLPVPLEDDRVEEVSW